MSDQIGVVGQATPRHRRTIPLKPRAAQSVFGTAADEADPTMSQIEKMVRRRFGGGVAPTRDQLRLLNALPIASD